MRVGDLVHESVVTVGPTHTIAEAVRVMVERNVGCAVVITDDTPGVISERDVMRAVASGKDLTSTTVADHMTWNAVVATREWDSVVAAQSMLDGGFRHLIVMDEGREIAILSIRDLVAAMIAEV